ncbi:WD repeat-containing protein 36 [Thelohanellus kitauei]|uniref:WD repeat-containing protein 36 n=1 Tax=Thelohanellus kitauei TaxID=669202 RepID=A0A0C2JJ31_THEKT|nr:WD repeat-containing protein 36 [Thelohanellus kitauei]
MDISSRIFHQYRVIGNFCCEKGFCMENVGSNNFVTTSIGNAFHTYDVKKLNLIAASDPVVETIHMLSSTENGEILCAHGTKLSVWKRGKMIGEPWIHESNISRIYAIGNVVACYEESGELNVYHVPERRLISSIQFSGEFEITAWCHPPTYINKIVIGFKSGHLQIWNIITCQMVQSLTKFEGQITCIKESPILDIIAVGVGSLLYIFNCKKNENIFLFKSDIEIAFISFRNTKDDVYHLAFCGVQSDILILDIEKNQLVCSIPAHTKNISGINYVNCQPLLVTASGDNSIKIWIFDHMDGSARLLKSRSGIPDSISKLRFIPGPRGLNLLSASGSFLRFTNCNRDEQSFDFSYGRPRKDWKDKSSESRPFYLPPISDFDEYFFDNIVTCHQKTNWVQAWRLDKKKISKLKLKHSLLQNQIPTCVKITACGNNCMVGYNHGSLELFNLESGAHRASFVDTGRKSSAIVGVAVDGRNILCASIDKSHLRIWFFKNHSLKTRVKLLFSPKKIEINRQK